MNLLNFFWFCVLSFLFTGIIASCGKPTTEVLITQLSDKQSGVRRKAAYALVDAGESSLKPLIKIIPTAPDTVRYIGAQILGRIGSPSARFTLLKLSYDENSHVKNEALRALGKIHQPDLIDTLIKFTTQDRPEKSRAAAIEGLSSFRDTSILPTVMKLMTDNSHIVRKEALTAIGKLWTKKAEATVIDLISDSNETIRYIAVQLSGVRQIKQANSALHLALNDPSIHVRTEAVKSLGLLKDTTAIPFLIKMIKKFEGPDTRVALTTLRELTGDEYIVQ